MYGAVDPAFANAANYSIVVSDGVVNAIPEPGTLTLLACALAGFALRAKPTSGAGRI